MNITTITEITTGFTFAEPAEGNTINTAVRTAVQVGRPNQRKVKIKPPYQD